MADLIVQKNVLVPVIILSGFLGSGKTMVLNYLLTEQQSRKIAVLINEFGAVSVDHRLVVHQEEDLVQLANGCVCCSIRHGLKKALLDLKARDTFDAIVIEASGVADPAPLLQTFLEVDMEEEFAIDALLTVVHSELLRTHLEISPVTSRQIRSADILLLSHQDLVSPEHWETVTKLLEPLNSKAPLLISDHGRVPLDAVLGPHYNQNAREYWRAAEPVNHDFQTIVLESSEAMSREDLETWLETLPQQGIIRAKGIVLTEKRTVTAVHLVGARVTMDTMTTRTTSNQMVFIGRDLDEVLQNDPRIRDDIPQHIL